MNDELLLDNYLMILKSTVEVYVHGTLESSNEAIRNILKKGLNETMEHQANTYDEMVKCNWYTIDNIECNVIEDTLIRLNNGNN